MINRLAEHLPGASRGAATKSVPERLADSLSKVNLRSYLDPVEQAVKRHPGAALAAAFLLGVTVAWWIKRR